MKRILAIALLFLPIGLSFFLNFIYPIIAYLKSIKYDYRLYDYLFTILSYLCIAVWLWLERSNLGEFNIDRLSIAILIIFGFYRGTNGINHEIIYKAVIWVLTIAILLVYLKNYARFPATKRSWILIAVLTCLLVIPLAYFTHILKFNIYSNFIILSKGFLWNALRNSLYFLMFVSPMEEIIFRGILWGQLRRWGLMDKKILWVQGVVFWLVHFSQLGPNPIAFFTIVPFLIVIFSLLVYYSKQLAPSIIFHTASDALIALIVQLYLH